MTSQRGEVWGSADTGAIGVLEIFLHGLHHELLHFLPDRQVWHLRSGFPTLPLRLPRRLCHRNSGGRYAGRQVWQKVCHLVFYLGSGSVRPHHAIRQSDVDHHLHLPIGFDYRFSVFIHRCVCHRLNARQGRIDSRHLLRTDVWIGRSRLCLLRLASRQDEHRVHLPGECLLAIAWHHRRLPAEYAEENKINKGSNVKFPHFTIEPLLYISFTFSLACDILSVHTRAGETAMSWLARSIAWRFMLLPMPTSVPT